MKLELPKGKYVVAVSGGVDSVVLLELLQRQAGLELIVAHYDHGIRVDSARDREFVRQLAKKYSLPFDYGEGKLGPTASEASARTARYAFLRQVKDKYAAQAIITAHHQDDAIETAIINLLRGTGRKGLTALASTDDVLRPLLPFSKQQILSYAKKQSLQWREDSTNADTKYLRNYVRLVLVPKLGTQQRQELLRLIENQRSVNARLDELLLRQLGPAVERLQRRPFSVLPHRVACETMAAWLRLHGIREFDKAAVERAVVGSKTGQSGKKIAVKNGWFIEVEKEYLALERRER